MYWRRIPAARTVLAALTSAVLVAGSVAAQDRFNGLAGGPYDRLVIRNVMVIPGHGELATRADLIAWRAMIGTAVERVQALKTAGRTLDQAKAAKPLAGLANAPDGFVTEDAFVEAIWGSLEAHGR